MPLKPIIDVKCPCCKHVLEVDVEKERVISHRAGHHLRDDAQDGEDGMDVAMRQKRENDASLEDKLAAAARKESSSAKRLDDLFRQASEKVKKEGPAKDDDPKNPFSRGKIWD